MVNLFSKSKSKSTKYQGFSKYNEEMSRYLSTPAPSTGLGRSLSMTSGPPHNMASAAAAAAACADRIHSSSPSPSSKPVNRSYSLASSRAPRTNSMRSYVYNPSPSYHTGPPIRSNSLSHTPRANSLASRQRYIPEDNDYIEEDDEVIVTTKTTKVLDRNGRTQSLTTQITKILPDGSRVVETTSKNISRSNSRANSLNSNARTGSILSNPSNQVLTLGKIDEDLRDFDYSYALNNDHLGTAINVPDMPPKNDVMDNTAAHAAKDHRMEPMFANSQPDDPSTYLSPEPSVYEMQPPANRSSSISSKNSSQKPLRSILKSTPRPHIVGAAASSENDDLTQGEAPISLSKIETKELNHQAHPYALLSPMDSVSVPPSPEKISTSNSEIDNKIQSGPKQPRTSSITFDTITKTIPIYDHENSRPRYVQYLAPQPQPKPKRKTVSDAEFYAAALRAAHKNVYGDREVPVDGPPSETIADKIAPPTPASPSPVIPRDDALDPSYQYGNHPKEFSMRSMKDAPLKTVSRKERAKEEKHRAKLERDHAKQEQARLARLEKETQAKLAKEAHEEKSRLAKEAKETDARLAKEAKQQAKLAKESERASISSKNQTSRSRRFLQASANGSVHNSGTQGLGLSIEKEKKRRGFGLFNRRSSVASSATPPPPPVAHDMPELPENIPTNHHTIYTEVSEAAESPHESKQADMEALNPAPIDHSNNTTAKSNKELEAGQPQTAINPDKLGSVTPSSTPADNLKVIALTIPTVIAPINDNRAVAKNTTGRTPQSQNLNSSPPQVASEISPSLDGFTGNTADKALHSNQTHDYQKKPLSDSNHNSRMPSNTSDVVSDHSNPDYISNSAPNYEPANAASELGSSRPPKFVTEGGINPYINGEEPTSALSTEAEIKSATLLSGDPMHLARQLGSSHTASSSGSNRDVSPSSFVRVQNQGSQNPTQFAASPKMSVNSIISLTSVPSAIDDNDRHHGQYLNSVKRNSNGVATRQTDNDHSIEKFPIHLAVCPPKPEGLGFSDYPTPDRDGVDTSFIEFDGMNNKPNANAISSQTPKNSAFGPTAPEKLEAIHPNHKPSPSLSNRSFAVTSPLSESEAASIVNDDNLIFATPLANTAGSISEVPVTEHENPSQLPTRKDSLVSESESGGRFRKILFKYFVKT